MNALKHHAAALQTPENSTNYAILANLQISATSQLFYTAEMLVNLQISATSQLFYTAEMLVFPTTPESLVKIGEIGRHRSR